MLQPDVEIVAPGRPQVQPADATELAIRLGIATLQSGARSDDAEAAMVGTAARFEVPLQARIGPSELLAVAGALGQQAIVLRRLTRGEVSIRRLADLQALQAGVVACQVDAAEGLRRIDRFCAPPAPGSPLLQACLLALILLCMSMLLGGGWSECLAAGCAGCAAGLMNVLSTRLFAGPAMTVLLAATAASIVAISPSPAIGPFSTTIVLTTGFITLIPAAHLLTSFLEIGHRRTMAGVERLSDASITLLALVTGVAVGSVLIGIAPALREPVAATPVPPWMLPLGFAGFGFAWAIMNQARRRDFAWIGVLCVVGQVAAIVSSALPNVRIVTFLGAFVVGATAQWAARRSGLPASLVALPGIIQLLPVALALSGALHMIGPDAGQCVVFVTQTALILLLLAAGLMTAEVMFGPKRRVERP
jgi:uncharacterized membrane protein YjjP (DUF1212 family)